MFRKHTLNKTLLAHSIQMLTLSKSFPLFRLVLPTWRVWSDVGECRPLVVILVGDSVSVPTVGVTMCCKLLCWEDWRALLRYCWLVHGADVHISKKQTFACIWTGSRHHIILATRKSRTLLEVNDFSGVARLHWPALLLLVLLQGTVPHNCYPAP